MYIFPIESLYAWTIQFVTASETAVFISLISSIVGSSCVTNAATAARAKPSLFDLEGIKVARVGIHLGEIVKGRFSPSHSLAIALRKEEIKQTVDYSNDSKEIIDYLKGQTINSELKGYVGVCVNGVVLAWGKASDHIIKNMYPKGLRIH